MTTMSALFSSPAAGAGAFAGSPCACAAERQAGRQRRGARKQHETTTNPRFTDHVTSPPLRARSLAGGALCVHRASGSSMRDEVEAAALHADLGRRRQADVLEVALARIGAGDGEAQARPRRDHPRQRRSSPPRDRPARPARGRARRPRAPNATACRASRRGPAPAAGATASGGRTRSPRALPSACTRSRYDEHVGGGIARGHGQAAHGKADQRHRLSERRAGVGKPVRIHRPGPEGEVVGGREVVVDGEAIAAWRARRRAEGPARGRVLAEEPGDRARANARQFVRADPGARRAGLLEEPGRARLALDAVVASLAIRN